MKELLHSKVYGDYECTHLLGLTASGAVYKATHVDDDTQQFALRTLQIHSKNDDVVDECNEYMESIKTLDVPNIVPIIDYGHLDDDYFVVMPYVHGATLRVLFKQTDKTPESMPSLGEILNFAQTLGDALKTLHNLHMAHGAIQPRNIIVTPQHEVYLADFGLARLIKILFALENTGSFFTGQYTAPEVWDGERITPSSDLYALACVLYHLVTGRAPFDGKSIYDQMEQHKSVVITPPHYIRKGLPFPLTMFFLTGMAKTSIERYRSVDEFLNEFAIAIAGNEGEPTRFFEMPLEFMDD